MPTRVWYLCALADVCTVKEMDLESHPWATSMVRQRAQEAAALCDNLHWSPPFEHPHGDDEVAVVTFFWMKDQQEAFESNPHFYEIRSVG